MGSDAAVAQRQHFAEQGFVWLRDALTGRDLNALDRLIREDGQPGVRIAAAPPTVLGAGGALSRALADIFGPVKATRVVAFSKSQTSNWSVGWHRDQVVAVKARADVDGFCNWSRKSGIWHCKPPETVLAGCLFTRVFLTDVAPASGGMEFCAGSHLEKTDTPQNPVFEQAARGDVLVLHMNILHRSRPSTLAPPRRVLRIDFATQPLPEPLEWAEVA